MRELQQPSLVSRHRSYKLMFMLGRRLRTVRTPSRSYPGRRTGWVFVFAVAVGVAMSCGGRSCAAEPGSEQGMASLSFLVLPFANPSGDPDQNYVAVNVTSDLTARLSDIAGSVVIARSSALAIASQSLPLAEIGRLFGVRYVLRGEAFTEGTHIHLTARLVRAENEEPLWSERFEREFAALWNLEREIVAGIARRLDVTHADVGPHSPPEAAQDAAALDSLLRGLGRTVWPHVGMR